MLILIIWIGEPCEELPRGSRLSCRMALGTWCTILGSIEFTNLTRGNLCASKMSRSLLRRVTIGELECSTIRIEALAGFISNLGQERSSIAETALTFRVFPRSANVCGLK